MQLYHRYLKLPFNFEKPTLYDSIELKDYCEFIYFKDEDLKKRAVLMSDWAWTATVWALLSLVLSLLLNRLMRRKKDDTADINQY